MTSSPNCATRRGVMVRGLREAGTKAAHEGVTKGKERQNVGAEEWRELVKEREWEIITGINP